MSRRLFWIVLAAYVIAPLAAVWISDRLADMIYR